MGAPDDARLDNPVYAALTGPQVRFAERRGRAIRYQADVAPFLALPPEAGTDDWADAALLVAPGAQAGMLGAHADARAHLQVIREFEVLQMIAGRATGSDDPEAVRLTRADVPEMLALVRATNPGPFLDRTVELGVYLGIRHGGMLVAMAGERMHLDGWREISAVCTAPTHRGQGLATRLTGAIGAGIERRSERAFLHVVSSNVGAIALYEQLGFEVRARSTISVVARR
jgi:predicted GNAT family acetyltransferase